MVTYGQKQKNSVRQQSLSSAIKLLTEQRQLATLADKQHLRKVWIELRQNGTPNDQYYNSKLSLETIERWEKFYDSIVGVKKASDLKIAYLCGPEPMNDLEILIQNGVLAENVWAFESDINEYNTAVINALNSQYPFLKILKTDMKTFIETSPIRFDLIYLDFCGPLYNRNKDQKNLSTIVAIAKYHSLNSPGILLTNFSLPTELQDESGHHILKRLIAGYLFPKSFLEEASHDSGITEGSTSQGYSEESWEEIVATDLPKYYSQFVTRLVMDVFSYLVPLDRFMNNNKYLKMFFKLYNNNQKVRYLFKKKLESLFNFSANGGGGDVITDPDFYTSTWMAAAFKGIWNYTKNDEKFIHHGKNFLKQLTAYSKNEDDFFEKIAAYQYLMTEGLGQDTFYSDSLKKISDNWHSRDKYLFCDVFLFHQLKDLLIRQISVPYQVNVERTKRWSYKAKETEMFTDMFVLDDCRYVYDWMPTLDMLELNLQNEEQELSFRYIMDAIGKHSRWYYEELFNGTAIIDMSRKGFEVKTFHEREKVT